MTGLEKFTSSPVFFMEDSYSLNGLKNSYKLLKIHTTHLLYWYKTSAWGSDEENISKLISERNNQFNRLVR